MAKSLTALINSQMLIWAREYSYLPLEEAAKKIGITSDKLKAWEKGDAFPTVNQLHEVARIYRQPFAVFYLSAPPGPTSLTIKDYRRLPGDSLQRISPELASEIRIALNRREIYIELIQELGEQIPDFSLLLNINDRINISAENIRSQLDIAYKDQKKWRDSRIAFNHWREAIEKKGILVFQSSQLIINDARGFSLGEFPLPVIVVNRKDTYNGRIFTLLHEYAHILLRTSGVCNVDPDIVLPPGEQKVEIFCNQIAAETLMPQTEFIEEYQFILQGGSQFDLTDTKIEYIATQFSVSREAAVRRMLTLGLVTNEFYTDKRDHYLREYQKTGKSSGFVTPAINAISLAGKPYTRIVLNAFVSKKITINDVAGYLGVKIKHLKEIGSVLGVS